MKQSPDIRLKGMINRIIKELELLGIERVILFGSYADGTASENSDIDLLVVTSDNFIPQSFNDKKNISLTVNNALSFVRDQYPLDIIVQTRPMYQAFLKQNSSFQREISSKGVVLYEKHN